MDRREFLKSTGAAAAAATAATAVAAESATVKASPAGVTAPNLATGTVELRLATSWPDAVAGPADQARRAVAIASLSPPASGTVSRRCAPAKPTSTTPPSTITSAPIARSPTSRACRATAGSRRGTSRPGCSPAADSNCGRPRGQFRRQGHARPSYGRATLLRGVAARRRHEQALRRKGCRLRSRPRCSARIWPRAREDPGSARHRCAHAWRACGRGMRWRHRQLRARPLARRELLRRHEHQPARSGRVARDAPLAVGQPARERSGALCSGGTSRIRAALAEEEAQRPLLYPASLAANAWPVAPELSRTIRRVADAVVAHVAASDAHAQRINAGYEAFRRALPPETPSLVDAVT